MGANLTLFILEFPIVIMPPEMPRVMQPDWDKAKQHIDALDGDKCIKEFANALGIGIDDVPDHLVDDEFTLRDTLTREEMRVKTRLILRKSVDEVRELWESSPRNACKIGLSNSVILVAGGSSWGDSFEEIDSMNMFNQCGAAQAAGFIN